MIPLSLSTYSCLSSSEARNTSSSEKQRSKGLSRDQLQEVLGGGLAGEAKKGLLGSGLSWRSSYIPPVDLPQAGSNPNPKTEDFRIPHVFG